MRWALALPLLSACSFEHGVLDDASMPDTVDAFQPTWAVDQASKKGVPASSSDWMDVSAAAHIPLGAPDALWAMQESSGNIADSIGSSSLQPFNIPANSYGLSVAGWSRHAIATPELTSDHGYSTNNTGNLDGTSYLLLVYVADVAVPPTDRALAGIGASTDHHYVMITSTGRLGLSAGGSPTIGSIALGTAVHPLVLKIDPNNSIFAVYSDQEKLVATWTATAGLGKLLVVGNAAIGAADANYLYGAAWTGAKTHLADGDIKTMLEKLGWTVTGY